MVRIVEAQAPHYLHLFARERGEEFLNGQNVVCNLSGRVNGRPGNLISFDGLFVPCSKADCMYTKNGVMKS